MVQLVAVTQERYGAKKWQRNPSYGFAAAEALVPIVGAELARVAMSMPTAFAEQSGHYSLVVVLSLTAGRNMFVGPDGRWLGNYVPTSLRAYPFRLLARQGTDEVVLCVDEDSGLVVGENSVGEDFFDKDGNVSPALKAVLEFLTQVERTRKATDLAVSALAEAGVIRPWQIKLKTEQGERPVNGLHHVDEAALRALPDDAFLKLRKASALTLADAQMLSMGHLDIFEHLARVQAQLTPPPVAALPESIDSLFEMPSNDIIRFS